MIKKARWNVTKPFFNDFNRLFQRIEILIWNIGNDEEKKSDLLLVHCTGEDGVTQVLVFPDLCAEFEGRDDRLEGGQVRQRLPVGLRILHHASQHHLQDAENIQQFLYSIVMIGRTDKDSCLNQ